MTSPMALAQSGNSVLDEIDRAHAALSPPAKAALEQAHSNVMATAAPAAGMMGPQQSAPAPGAPVMPPPSPMAVPGAKAANTIAPPAATPDQTAHIANLNRLQSSPSGIGSLPAWAKIPLSIADAIGGGLFPGIEQRLPGTQGHHDVLMKQAQSAVNSDEMQRNSDVERGLKTAQTENQASLPELHQGQLDQRIQHEADTTALGQAKNELMQTKADSDAKLNAAKQDASLRFNGFKRDETGALVPLDYTEMSQSQRAVHDLKTSQAEMDQATAELKKAQATNSPVLIDLAKQRAENAKTHNEQAWQKLTLAEHQYEMRAHGTENGQALPGAILGDDNKPVGTAFQQNVRPTGTERNKGDMAVSAHEQLNDIKSIVQKRPDIFGPAAGRKTNFDVWLGSQDPDAQRFRAARTIAGDHLAGTFGGRSETALKSIDDAIGQFKDNPQAVLAGLDQLDKANTVFLKRGTPKAAGSNAAAGAPATGGTVKLQGPDGSTRDVPADQADHYIKLGAKKVAQ